MSTNTICKDCETLNMRAHNLLKKKEAGEPYDEASLRQLKMYYSRLAETGRPPLTAAARRLIGLQPLDKSNKNQSADNLISVTMSADLLKEHLDKVRERSYATFEEADAMHRRLSPQLREAGMYEEVNNLMDDWYLDL